MTHKTIFSFVVLLVAAILTGCGGGGVQLRGTVTFEDGSPVTSGTVVFDSGTIVSRGDIQSDGTYRLSTERPGDGIPPGTYTVYLINTEVMEEVPTADGSFTDRTIQTVAPQFTSRAASDITVTVDSSTRTFDFQVQRHQGR